MASASVISLESVCLVRVTVPVGTHPVIGMHPYLLELYSCEILVLTWYRHRLCCRSRPGEQPCSSASWIPTNPFSLERLRPSRVYRKKRRDLCYEFLTKGFEFVTR